MKKKTILNPTYLVMALSVAGICTLASMNLQANEIQAGRYSMLSATPTKAQADLLATTVTVQFPERILNIGEAVRHLLQRSGYRLASPEASGQDIDSLFALPLPAVHRNLGPMTLQDALETLAGPEFHLVQDPVHRLITFEHCAVDQLDQSNKHRNGGRTQ